MQWHVWLVRYPAAVRQSRLSAAHADSFNLKVSAPLLAVMLCVHGSRCCLKAVTLPLWCILLSCAPCMPCNEAMSVRSKHTVVASLGARRRVEHIGYIIGMHTLDAQYCDRKVNDESCSLRDLLGFSYSTTQQFVA
jgi:hypothetical protein